MIIKNSRITDYLKPEPKPESKEIVKENHTQITLSKTEILSIK